MRQSPDQALPTVDLNRRYVPMPPETTFLESACHNQAFRPGSVFLPVTAAEHPEVCGLYELHLADGRLDKLCSLPTTGLYFGSKITAEGICYLCVGNEGKVLSVDLRAPSPSASVLVELPGSFEPNDLTLDEARGRLLIACNDQIFDVLSTRGQTLNALRIAGKSGGSVFEYRLDSGELREYARGLRVLAGSILVPEDDALWLSELNNLVRVPLDAPDEWTRVHPFDRRLLADNLELRGTELVFPYYRVVSGVSARIMQSKAVSRLLLGMLRFVPERWFGEPPPQGEASDRFEDVCIGRYDLRTGAMHSYRIDIVDEDFDGHCTHVEWVGDELVFINYLEPQILIVDAKPIFASRL